MPKKPKNRRFNDILPEHIQKSVLQETRELVSSLSTCGWKGFYLGEQCFSKYCDPTTTPADVRRAAAIEKWLATERRNSATNSRLQMADEDMSFGWITWGKLRDDIRGIVAKVLGPVHYVGPRGPSNYPTCFETGMHTNGASTRVKRGPTAAIDKFSGEAHSSFSALCNWLPFAEYTVLEDQTIGMKEESDLFTVPKSTDIDRVACKEPEINMFLQRGVGNHIRKRLKKFGVDLNDQSLNRQLAATAVKQGLATIDLSSASDSISRQLVIELLPFDWWALLDDLRVKHTRIDGRLHDLEMFSSMGNGFTFELESLLFYAITRVVCWRSGLKGRVSVYGDDIIAPNGVVPRLKRVFDFLGFKLNPKKTNWRGMFRESCGGHYYCGVDVTPFYVRGPIARVTDLIRLLNQLLEWDGRGWGMFTTPEVVPFHRKWASVVPQFLHGGQDIASSDSLVTGTRPRYRLVPERSEVPHDRSKALLLWHTARSLSVRPLSVEPLSEGAMKVVPQSEWLVRTSWTPYIAFE